VKEYRSSATPFPVLRPGARAPFILVCNPPNACTFATQAEPSLMAYFSSLRSAQLEGRSGGEVV